MADAASYPAIGLQVDFDDFRRLDSEVERSIQGYTRLRQAAEAASRTNLSDAAERSARVQQQAARAQEMSARQILAAQRGLAAQQQQMDANVLRSRIALSRQQVRETERAVREETRAAERANAEQLADFRRMMNERIALGRAAAKAEEADAQRAFRTRMALTRQQNEAELRAIRERQAYLASAAAANARSGAGGTTAAAVAAVSSPLDLARGAIGRFNQASAGLRDSLHRLRVAFFDIRTVVALFLGGLVVGPIVRFADAMTALEARIGFFASRQQDVPYLFEAVYEAAQRSRAPLEAVGTLYTRLAPLADQLGKSQLELLRITETVQKGIAIGGASAAEAASSSQQLAQALASNRLGGDELRSLAENAPVLLGAIARELNMNTGQFIKWAHEGRASAEVVVGALERAAPRIDALFAQFPVTIGQGVTVVTNAITKMVGEVNRATGAGEALGNALVNFSQFVSSPQVVNALVVAVNGLGTAFTVLAQGVDLVVAALPALAAAAAVVVTRMVLATAAVSRFGVVFSAVASGVGVGSATMIAATSAASTAMAGLAAAGRGLLAFFGGPLGVAVIAAAGAFAFFADTQRKAAASAQNLVDNQQGAISALDRAIAFADAYGVANDNLSKTLESVVAGGSDASREALNGVAANDQAAKAATLRAERERLLTITILRRAAADAQAAGAEDQATAARIRGVANVLRFVSKARPDQFGRQLYDTAAAQKYEEASQLSRSATTNFNLATALSQAQTQVATAALNIAVPAAVGDGGAQTAAEKATKGLDGAINRIARMSAEVEGLRAQIAALNTDPLSDIQARIQAAGDEAAAQYTSGKAADAGFAARARSVAMMREELQIRLELTRALIEQRRRAEEELEVLKLEADGQKRAEQIMQGYFSRSVASYQDYVAAVNRAKDAQAEAAVSANDLRIAMQYGVRSLTDISQALQTKAGFTQEAADALQAEAIATASADAANIRYKNTTDQAAESARAYTDALEELQRQRTELADLEYLADAGFRAREASARTQVIQEALLAEARANNVALSNEEARAQAEILAIEEQRRANLAKIKIEIQDSIRQAFVDTGRLDFTSLKDGVKRALREAVYDALIAKPINIVVNAVVNIATQAIQNALSGILGGPGGGLVGGLSGLLGLNANGGYASSNRRAMDDLVDAATGIEKATRGLGAKVADGAGSLFRQGVNTLAYAAVGNTLYGAVGGKQNTGSMIGSGLGAIAGGWAAGTAVGAGLGSMLGIAGSALGPIGMVVGSILGSALGSLFGGKPSNQGALATFNGDSFSLAGNKRTEQTSQLATAAAQAVLAGQQALRDAGITLTDSVRQIDIGVRDATDIILASGRSLTSAVGDSAAAADTALKALLQTAQFQDEAQKRLVDSMLAAGSSFDDIVKKLQAMSEALDFIRGVDRSILQFTDPQAYELSNLADAQRERRRQAQSYLEEGLITAQQFAALNVQLGKLEQLELDDLLKRFADSLTEAQQKAKDAVDKARDDLERAYESERSAILENIAKYQRLADALDSFYREITVGSLAANTDGQQYELTRAQFMSAAAAARAGDADAMGRLPELGQAFLEASRNSAVTLADYQRDLAQVRRAVEQAQLEAQTQVDQGEAALERLDASVAGLITINDSVLSVQAAIVALQEAMAAQAEADRAAQAALAAALANYQKQQAANQNTGGTGGTNQGEYDFSAYIARYPDVAAEYQRNMASAKGREYLASQNISSVADFGRWHYQVYGQAEGRNPYAESAGMPLTLSSSRSTSASNDNAVVAAVLDSLTGSIDKLQRATEAGALGSIKTAKILTDWNYDGQPEERDIA